MKRLLLIGIALFAAMCSDDDGGEQIVGPTDLSLISFNLRCPMPEDTGDLDWDVRKKAVLEMVRQEKPDVICFQEPRWNQVAYLMQQLGEYAHVKKNTNEGGAEASGAFNTIMYLRDKYTLLESGGFWLSATPDKLSYPWAATDEQRRVTVWVHLKDNATNRDFFVFTTHLPYMTEQADNEARVECVKLNVERMKTYAGEDVPVFIGGDMNASHAETDGRRDCLEPYYAWMLSARETAAQTDEKYSFNGFGLSTPAKTWNIDHIFYRNAEALQFKTLDGDYGVPYISDLYPIACTFKL